jgi:hypothetical protein
METTVKTWGPFNGRQLTTLVCVIAATILLPVGAWATVSFSNVAITDPGGVNRAKVDATGKLAVGDGSGPLTVDGTISANPSLPARPIVITATDLGTAPTTIYGPQSKPFGITSLTLTVVPTCGTQLFTLRSVTSTGGKYDLMDTLLDAGKSVQYLFPTPLVTTPPAGGSASLTAFTANDSCVIVSGVGIQK